MVHLTNKSIDSNEFFMHDGSETLDLIFLWRLIQNKRWVIFTITAIVLTISTIYTFQLPTVYTARTKILIEKMDQSAFQNPEILKPQADTTTYYQTRAELVKSRSILELAANQLNLLDHYRKLYKIETNQQAVALLNGKTDTKILKGTQIIELSVTDQDPAWAAKIADAISEIFLRESWRERFFVSEQLLKWFPQEGETLKQSSPINQLEKLNRQDAIAALPSVLRDPVLSNIKQDRLNVDAQIKELSRRYTPEHPKMKELLSRAEYLESEMKAQMDKIISGLKSGLAGEFGVSNIKIVEKAEIPNKPSGPRRLRLIFIATLLSFIASILVLTLLHHLDQNIQDEEDVRNIPLPFLGYLPLITNLNVGSGDDHNLGELLTTQILSDPKLNNEISNLRAALLFSMPAARSKLLMCTSAIPEEGKTTIASILSMALAEIGEKVILIDADMRKPSLHGFFNLENQCGLTNYLVGSAELKDVIQKVNGLSVITAGEHTPNPAILLSSTTIDHLIADLEPDYDRIIFDVPPSLHIPDGLILAGKVHGTILVFNAGRVHQNVGKKMKEKIASANGTVIGGVINRANYKRLDYHYYYHYRKYSKYYHKSEETPKTGLENLEAVKRIFQGK